MLSEENKIEFTIISYMSGLYWLPPRKPYRSGTVDTTDPLFPPIVELTFEQLSSSSAISLMILRMFSSQSHTWYTENYIFINFMKETI